MEEVVDADYVYVMDKGHVVMEGKPEEILVKEKELLNLHLDIPFALKFVNALKEEQVELSPCITMERVVEELWQSALKK